jgi:hypothetical protein
MKRFLPHLKSAIGRRAVLTVTILGLVASVVAGRERPVQVVEPAARIDTRIRPSAEEIDLSNLERAENPAPAADPFASRSFAGPQAAAKPAKPAAPELPFRYVGKIIENGRLSVFLSRGEESLSVKAGQTIGEYRVESVTESEITFTYLPLKTRQTLPL